MKYPDGLLKRVTGSGLRNLLISAKMPIAMSEMRRDMLSGLPQ
jgi:hypothetical protein